jgi:hypothetical protein
MSQPEGCSARVVADERLGGWFLIDDEEAIGAANNVLERDVLVARDDGETIVLATHLFVLPQRHRYALFTSDVALAIRLPALAVKLERHFLISEPGCLVQLFDLLVDLAHEGLVSGLPLRRASTRKFYAFMRPRTSVLSDRV